MKGTDGETLTWEQVKARNEAGGYYYFLPERMRWFNSQEVGQPHVGVDGLTYLVVSNQPPSEARYYQVIRQVQDGAVQRPYRSWRLSTPSLRFASVERALREAEALAAGTKRPGRFSWS